MLRPHRNPLRHLLGLGDFGHDDHDRRRARRARRQRVARLVRGESRFGAELDSLSDAISFGVSPAIIVYLWSLRGIPRVGWLVALVFAVFCALRLARFNANIDVSEQPHKSAGFLTGIPAPAGAGLAMLPIYLSFWNDAPVLRSPWLVAPWVGFIASLMVSSVATFSWSSLKLRHHIRFEAIVVVVLLGAALISAPWQALSGNLCRLSRLDPVQHPQLSAGQAAARSDRGRDAIAPAITGRARSPELALRNVGRQTHSGVGLAAQQRRDPAQCWNQCEWRIRRPRRQRRPRKPDFRTLPASPNSLILMERC